MASTILLLHCSRMSLLQPCSAADNTFLKPDEHFHSKILATLLEGLQTWPCTILRLHTSEVSDLGLEIYATWWPCCIQGWVLWSLLLHSFSLQQFFRPVLIVQSSCIFSICVHTCGNFSLNLNTMSATASTAAYHYVLQHITLYSTFNYWFLTSKPWNKIHYTVTWFKECIIISSHSTTYTVNPDQHHSLFIAICGIISMVAVNQNTSTFSNV
jgi:hypothetical protein